MFLGSKYGNLIAVDAWQGKEVWQKMVGNWIDNTACIGEIDDEKVVYVSSHDYFLYVFKAENGDLLWKRVLGGEVYSAPCFFYHGDRALVAAASLNNHLYIVDARKGDIVTSYFTGRPIWDKVAKGDTLWGSLCVLVISVFLPRFCFFLDFFNVIDFSIQALSSEHVQLYLSHVEPTPMLRSVHKSHNIADLLRRQGKYQES